MPAANVDKKKLYLVDVSSMFFRAFYAIRNLSNPAGMPVNAIYGFISMTVKLMREIRPDYMVFCFDRSEDTFRKQIDPNYKANRSEMPEDMRPQIPYMRTVSDALGICCMDAEGFEADDVIGTLTKFGCEKDLEVVIVSGDKDFAQLISPCVSMYDTMKDVRYDEAGALEKWGVPPAKMIDYLAIVGDSSDNVPGVAGLGPKGAQKLLTDYGSLEEIYEHIDDISGAAQKKLIASRESAFLSKRLVTIVCDMNIHPKLEDLKLRPIHREDLTALLTELDFKTFARTLLGADSTAATTSSATKSSDHHVEGSMSHVLNPQGKESAAAFTRKAPAAPAMVELSLPDLGVIEEKRLELGELAKWLRSGEETWVMESTHGNFIAQTTAKGYLVAEIAADGESLGAMLTEKKLRYKGFDIKSIARKLGIRDPEVAWDQMLAAYVIRAGNIDSLPNLFSLYNGEALPDLPSATQILTAHVHLETHLGRKLKSLNGEHVLFNIEQPLVPILLEMESAGIKIDPVLLKKQSESLGTDISAFERQIFELAGGPVNIGSPKQLGALLFEKLKMPTGKRTKTGYSTDTDVLEKLSHEYPIAGKILQWRELSKLRSTYVDALPLLADEDCRIHTTFNQAATSTGRLSSTNPNLQNIPIRTERGSQIRKAFVAEKSSVLVSADYSQLELRLLAHITSDPALVRAFESNLDIHTATAAEVFGAKLEDVTGEMRRKAKAVNYGLAYGQSAFGLAENLRIPRGEAAEIITRYFARFSGVKEYMTETVEEAKRKGYVETVFGRRRYLDELYSKSQAMKKFGERAAINAPIQGTASDLVKMAMIKVGRPANARVLLQIHDELVLETDRDSAEAVAKDVASKMQEAAAFKVPLVANFGFGPDWDAAHA